MSARDDLTIVPGFRLGSSEDLEAGTGCTVVLCPPEGAVGGVDQAGGAPGTRETDPLRPLHLVQRCHAVLLTGGSAFGLEAAAGVVRFLEGRGVGFDTRVARVPIVPAAVLYDLALGRADRRPDPAMGEAACLEAERGGPVRQGNAGAGCGATVGKVHGLPWAMKGGLGSAGIEVVPGVFVGAAVAVNAFGDVIDPSSGEILAGARRPRENANSFRAGDFADTVEVWRSRGGKPWGFGGARATASDGDPAGSSPGASDDPEGSMGTNTVLAVVATNAALDKEGANILALMAASGFARALRPVHSTVDGDTVFTVASGERECDVNLLGAVAADLVGQSIVRAVRRARTLHGCPGLADVRRDED